MVQAYKRARVGQSNDRHHAYVNKHYKETPHWWFVVIIVLSFVLGLIVVLKEDITLSAWAYVVALLLGCVIAPLVSPLSLTVAEQYTDSRQSTILYSRFGNGIATNNLSKMLAGLLVPGRPIGNMYFAAWSHNVISNTVNLSNDLKMGDYRKPHNVHVFLIR